MGTLRAGKDHFCVVWRSCGGGRQAHLDALVSHELHTGPPVLSAAPIPPKQRRGTNPERMQQDTDPTRLRGCFPIPLTLRTPWAAATIGDPGAVEHAQTAIGFPALLGWAQRLAIWTVQHPVGLEDEVLPRDRACEFTRNTGIALMERIAILCPEVREHPALSPFFSIPEKANKRVKRVNSQALAKIRTQ